MRYIKLKEFKQNNVIYELRAAQDIKDNFGRILITQGSKLDEKIVNKLIKLDIYGIYVNDEWSADIFAESTVGEEVIEESIEALRKNDLDNVYKCAMLIVDRIANSEDFMEDIESIRVYDEYTYKHCINVAITATTLGIGIGYEYERLKNLVIGAMLHDIGKQMIPIEIINKHGKLTDDEMKIVKQHPENGYRLLLKEVNTSSSIREIVHQHHENYNGTGYPRGLKQDEIYELAMLVHICDVYDALISKRSYKDAFSFADTIKILQDGRNKMFNSEMLDAFFKYVPIYHKGTKVTLSNKTEALIYNNNRGDMLRPTVKLKNGDLLDLRNSILTIVS